MEKLLVRCKYADHDPNAIHVCARNIMNNNIKNYNSCVDMFGQVNCMDPFYIDWVKYILYREHLINESI